jgi:predicted nucleotidyltransferase/uncharacterized protein with HEPN domain
MSTAQAPTLATLAARHATLERIAAAHGATNLRVCGSVARGDARPDSDVDLVVDLDDGRDILDLAELVLDLETELGRRVDVLPVSRAQPGSPYSPLATIVAEAIPLTAGAPAPGSGASSDHDRRLVTELRQSLALLRSYITGGEAAFMHNEMAVDAARQRLAAIADACQRLSSELKARHPEIRWRALGGMPAVTRHGPRGCWELVTQHLAPLEELLDREGPR